MLCDNCQLRYEDSVEDGIHLCTILRRTSVRSRTVQSQSASFSRAVREMSAQVRILLANSLKWFLPYKAT